MKHFKWIVPLAVVVLMLLIALPAAADDPFGGPPSKTSGNGTSTWAAIYIGGTWDNKRDVNDGFYKNPDDCSKLPLIGCNSSSEYDKYVTNWSAKVTIPAGGSRWFKFDTVRSRDVEIYVDDVPKWGAAYRYFDDRGCVRNGTGDCDRADNLLRLGIDTSEISKWWLATQDRNDFGLGDSMFRQGFATRLYGPESIQRMSYWWPTPNNCLLTTRAGGGPYNVGNTQGVFGGYNRGSLSVLGSGCYGTNPGFSYHWLEPQDVKKRGDGNTHLLGGKFHWDGWVYVRVFNNMIWDGDIQVGTRFTPAAGYDFPCANCPYPFNPQFSNP